MDDFSDLKQDHLKVRFNIENLKSLSLDKINECINRFNNRHILDEINNSYYLNIAFRKPSFVNPTRCALSKLNLQERELIKIVIQNMTSIFSVAFNNGIIVLNGDSNIPEKYWSLTKESEKQFWYYFSNEIENTSRKYYK